MPTPGTLILIGLRGSGKSTLGRTLAERLDRPFVDLDDVTAAAMGEPNAGDAIRAHGFDAFRKAEAESLIRVLNESTGCVLALGGGTPTADTAEQTLRGAQADGAQLCYLRAAPESLAARLATTDTSTRPSLTGQGVLDEISEVYQQRDPLYQSLADLVLDTDVLDEAGMLSRLMKWSESCP